MSNRAYRIAGGKPLEVASFNFSHQWELVEHIRQALDLEEADVVGIEWGTREWSIPIEAIEAALKSVTLPPDVRARCVADLAAARHEGQHVVSYHIG